MSDVFKDIAPIIAAASVPVISATIAYFQQRKGQGNSILKEQYINFIAPIFRLLNRDCSATYLITEINHVFDEYPYLVPDNFDEKFNKFKQKYSEGSDVKKSEFYECVENLYIYLRHKLHYSKKHLSGKCKKKTKTYLGKSPTFFGAVLRSFVMSCVSLIIVAFLEFLKSIGIVSQQPYFVLLVFTSMIMLFLTLVLLNRYYDVS